MIQIFLVYWLGKVYGKMCSSVVSSPAVTCIVHSQNRNKYEFASFYVVASAATWFDKPKTGMVSPYSRGALQDVAFVVVSAIILPWFCFGLRSIRLELRAWFLVFFSS
ncbi:hypothetical protein EDD16DRAFT_362698 [Pisolithus croceorrhizus]|nr:hypothetical protein EDD16DRAFT_362698 [Pisolithus croceorrhizus]